MPKYEEIANVLRERIKRGIYPPDSLLPNQTDLVNEFSVSRMTIKKAITILSMEGLVYSRRGSGTKVLNHNFWENETSPFNVYHGLSKDMKEANRELSSEVIHFSVMFPDKNVQEKLAVEAQHPVYKIIRLRILEGQPYVIEHTYMPTDLVPGLTNEILKHSIYDYLGELGVQFAGAFRNIQAAKPDSYDQKYLDCALDDPVLEVEQVVYLENGRPIEYSRSRNRYDQRGYSLLDVKS
jgi:GntR family transcriptional regulator